MIAAICHECDLITLYHRTPPRLATDRGRDRGCAKCHKSVDILAGADAREIRDVLGAWLEERGAGVLTLDLLDQRMARAVQSLEQRDVIRATVKQVCEAMPWFVHVQANRGAQAALRRIQRGERADRRRWAKQEAEARAALARSRDTIEGKPYTRGIRRPASWAPDHRM